MSEPAEGRTEVSAKRQWLTRLLSDERVRDRGKLAAIAALALLRGRHGRTLLRRLVVVTVFFIYKYLTIVELIAGILVLAEVAARLIPLFTPRTQPDRGGSAINNSVPSSYDGGNRTGPNTEERTRQDEEIQNHLQELTMAVAGATASADVASSLLHYHQHLRKQFEPTKGPGKSLQEVEESVVIHFQFPIYVCSLTFWNDIHITVPSSWATMAKRGSNGRVLDATGHFYHIEMRMWMEMNRDLVAVARNDNKPCEDCLMGSHSVGKRRFDCTFLDGYLNGALSVHKNTFHAGRKLTILGSNVGLNFKFETRLEQMLAQPGSNGPAAFQQRVTFALLPQTSKPDGQGSNVQQKASKPDKGSSPKRQGRSVSGLLAVIIRNISNSNSALRPVAKCSLETLYTLEDRRHMTKDNCRNSQLSWSAPSLGPRERELDGRLFGLTIAPYS